MIELLAVVTMVVIPYRHGLFHLAAYTALIYLVASQLFSHLTEEERDSISQAATAVAKAATRSVSTLHSKWTNWNVTSIWTLH